MSKAEIETVIITLDGEDIKLTPSAKVMMRISTAFGGVLNAVNACQAYNVDAMTTIIAIGAGLGDAEKEALPRRIFSTGLTELLVPIVRFLGLLVTGGRRKVAESGDS
ncbi:MAG: hypothetical protein RIB97_01010 [Nitratireductor sp.]